jgi:uncharacterized membrane protein
MCFVLTETQDEGATIPEAVPVEGVVPVVEVLEEAASGPAVTVAPEATEEVHDDALPESSMDVVVRSPEIQDVEPIRSAPMSEAAATSRSGIELLADDLVDPAMVARNLESMRRAEQWMKVRDSILE